MHRNRNPLKYALKYPSAEPVITVDVKLHVICAKLPADPVALFSDRGGSAMNGCSMLLSDGASIHESGTPISL